MEVVNLKTELKNYDNNFQNWISIPNHLYIGRNVRYYGTKHSKWGNPFPVKTYGRERCLELYEDHVRKNLWGSLEELKGKVLGCWCHPLPCHANILIKLFKEKEKKKRMRKKRLSEYVVKKYHGTFFLQKKKRETNQNKISINRNANIELKNDYDFDMKTFLSKKIKNI